jgi:hypothetical protein
LLRRYSLLKQNVNKIVKTIKKKHEKNIENCIILLTLKEELISFEIKCVTEALIPQSVKIKMN